MVGAWLTFGGELQEVLYKLIGGNRYAFIDDCHGMLYSGRYTGEKLLTSCKQLSVTNTVCVTCDLTQRGFFVYHSYRDRRVNSFIQDVHHLITLSIYP